ncbi:hypothetical protein [Kitasatospora purpeofusca]|uniref:hypothetical protein n=1 Tax=Kitasatospora purpeofusca TaxID=67352 RepID=UPI0038658677|nr:hypothetical protein OIP63_26960 [Kitasatospora purpeofusca]
MDGIIALGSGGAACVTTFTLFVGVRGKNRIKIEKENVPYWAYGIGLLSAGAGAAFSSLGTVGTQFNQAFSQAGGLGEWKAGATAAVLTICVFGLKPRAWKDSIFGAIAPTVFTAAGGLWMLPVTLPTGLLKALLGA